MTDTAQNTIRAFIAINLPEQVTATLCAFQRKLKSIVGVDWVRWTAPEQIHLTLRFLGNIPATSVTELGSVLQEVCVNARPFDLIAENFGWFPEGSRPRVLWVGVSGQIDVLNQLAEQVTVATANWGELENRKFQAHLTIGRVKTKSPNELHKLTELLTRVKPDKFGQWHVTQIDLMQSKLYPTGPVYTRILTVQLGG